MKLCPECGSELIKCNDAEGIFRCISKLCRRIFHILTTRVMTDSELKLIKSKYFKDIQNDYQI